MRIRSFFVLFVLMIASGSITRAPAIARVNVNSHQPTYVVPHATFARIHIGMSYDSVLIVFRNYAARKQVIQDDSMTYIETDSIIVFGQPAYLQAQVLHKRVRTVVINFHPLAGDRYLNIRDQVENYMQHIFGRGVVETDESMVHHRWETEEGTMEVTHSDKYTRVFIRLGKQRS